MIETSKRPNAQQSGESCCNCHHMKKLIKKICEETCGGGGTAGKDGITPHIGDNGNWWIGDTDTGVQAQGEKGEQGEPGTSGANIVGLQMQLQNMLDQDIKDFVPFDTAIFNNAENAIEINNGIFTIKETGLYYISYEIGYELRYATSQTPAIAIHVNNVAYSKASCWNNGDQIVGTALIFISDADTTIAVYDDSNVSMIYKDEKVQANIVIMKLS